MPPRPRLRPLFLPGPKPSIRTLWSTQPASARSGRDTRECHGSSSPTPSSSPPEPEDSPPPPAPPPASSPPPTDLPPTDLIISASHRPPPSSSTPQVPFSTQTFVRKIERRSDGTMGRGVATVIMEATRDLLQKEEIRVGNEAWRKGDLENKAYLFTAALSELKTSSQVKSRNDSTILRSMTAQLQRETDAIEQRLAEDVARLRSDIQLDFNNRKEEVNSDLKGLDRTVMDLNSKFTILLGEARTEIETVKWVSTRRVMSTLVVLVIGVVATISYYPKSSSASSSDSPPAPTVEDLGVRRTTGAEADVTGTSGWWFSGTGRVEGEGEGEEREGTTGT